MRTGVKIIYGVFFEVSHWIVMADGIFALGLPRGNRCKYARAMESFPGTTNLSMFAGANGPDRASLSPHLGKCRCSSETLPCFLGLKPIWYDNPILERRKNPPPFQ